MVLAERFMDLCKTGRKEKYGYKSQTANILNSISYFTQRFANKQTKQNTKKENNNTKTLNNGGMRNPQNWSTWKPWDSKYIFGA